MKRLVLALAFALALAATLAPSPVGAASLAGVTLPDSIIAGDQPLVLNGVALRSKLIFKVYVAGLYLPAQQGDAKAILASDQARRMEMRFVRSVSAGQICEGWNEGLAANVPNASPELKQQFVTLCQTMRDVVDGGHVTLTYLPGLGTEVDGDGKATATIPGKAFADAVLACWIGDHPGPGEDFKKALLKH